MRAINGGKPSDWLYGDRLHLGGVKLYDDGALGSRGAWLKQPYHDKPDTRGLQFHSDARAPCAGAGGRQATVFSLRSMPSATRQTPRSSRPMRSCPQPTARRPPLADRAFPDRRPGRYPAPEARRNHRLDAANPPDQRPADGGSAAWPGPAEGRLCLADRRKAGNSDCVRFRFPGRKSQSISGPGRSDQPSRHERPADGRMDTGRAGVSSNRRWPASLGARPMPALREAKIGSLDAGKWADFILVDRDVSAVAIRRTWPARRCWKPGSPGRRSGRNRLAGPLSAVGKHSGVNICGSSSGSACPGSYHR